jgi:hypothetical protein
VLGQTINHERGADLTRRCQLHLSVPLHPIADVNGGTGGGLALPTPNLDEELRFRTEPDPGSAGG